MAMRKTRVAEAMRWLEEARESAKFELAHFKNDEYTKEIREATRLYRDTWIIGRINRVLDILEEEITR